MLNAKIFVFLMFSTIPKKKKDDSVSARYWSVFSFHFNFYSKNILLFFATPHSNGSNDKRIQNEPPRCNSINANCLWWESIHCQVLLFKMLFGLVCFFFFGSVYLFTVHCTTTKGTFFVCFPFRSLFLTMLIFFIIWMNPFDGRKIPKFHMIIKYQRAASLINTQQTKHFIGFVCVGRFCPTNNRSNLFLIISYPTKPWRCCEINSLSKAI